jgi:hypothetical protein
MLRIRAHAPVAFNYCFACEPSAGSNSLRVAPVYHVQIVIIMGGGTAA